MADILTVLWKILCGFIDGLASWQFLCYGITLTTTLITAGQIPILHDILNDMYTKFLPYLIITGLAFFSGIVVKIGSVLCQWHKTQVAKQQLIENLLSLSESEVAVLKYVLRQKKGAVWLPVENIDVLSLYSRKCLVPIWNMSSGRGILGNYVQCYAYCVPEVIKSYIKKNSEEINKLWINIPEAEELSVYS